jgi:hypothetical protein
MHPWHVDSLNEVFGAAGWSNMLQSNATKLRLAHYGVNAKIFTGIWTALPTDTTHTTSASDEEMDIEIHGHTF